jgi:hypothetical protein
MRPPTNPDMFRSEVKVLKNSPKLVAVYSFGSLTLYAQNGSD